MIRGILGFVWILLLFAACSGSETSQQTKAASQACRYPTGVQTEAGASSSSCTAGPPGMSCEVSNGATIEADGSVSNGTKSCQSQCKSSEYEMSCQTPNLTGGAIPSPDAALGCQVIAEPTPSNALFYCCPCAK